MSDNTTTLDAETYNPAIPFLLFAAHPVNLKDFLIEKECFNKHTKAVMRELLDAVDRKETIRIHEVDPHAGITHYISANVIAEESGLGLRVVQYALAELKEKKVIEIVDRLEFKDIPRYKLNCYQPALAYLKANPDHPKCKVATLVPSVEEEASYRESRQADNADDAHTDDATKSDYAQDAQTCAGDADTYAPGAYSLDYKNLEEEPPPGPSGVTGDEPKPATVEEGGGAPEFSQREETADSIPGAAPGPGVKEKKKASQREEQAGESNTLSQSPSLLAEGFCGLFGPDKPTPQLIIHYSKVFLDRSAGEPKGVLMDLFDNPHLVDVFPDRRARAETCVKVVQRALRKLADGEWAVQHPGFLNTPQGQRAVSEVINKICNDKKRPSLVIDAPARHISEHLQPTEASEAEQVKPSVAWDRGEQVPLDPDMEALLERIKAGTPPPN